MGQYLQLVLNESEPKSSGALSGVELYSPRLFVHFDKALLFAFNFTKKFSLEEPPK